MLALMLMLQVYLFYIQMNIYWNLVLLVLYKDHIKVQEFLLIFFQVGTYY